MRISRNHPRFVSLETRERLVRGFQAGIVVPQGLIAHGRGEAFDYLFGEITPKSSQVASRVAAALLLSARNPVISINGNTAALIARDIVRLAHLVPTGLEVNLFLNTLAPAGRSPSSVPRIGGADGLGVDGNHRVILR